MFQDSLTVILPTRQLDKMTGFYRDTMSLPPVPGFNAKQPVFSAGKTGFIRVDGRDWGQGFSPTALWLEAGNVNAAYRRIGSAGEIRMLVDLTDTYYGTREFQILDIDGNISCIINYAKDLNMAKGQAETPLYGDEFRVVLYVKNLGACYRFYTETLGMKSIYQWEENRGDRGFKYELCPGSHAYVETLFREPLARQRQAVFALRAIDISSCWQRLSGLGDAHIACPLAEDVGGEPGFSLWDPDGNLVLVWAGNNNG